MGLAIAPSEPGWHGLGCRFAGCRAASTGHVADSSGLVASAASDSGFGCSIDPSEAVATEAAATRGVVVGHAEVAAVLLVGLGTTGCEPSAVLYPH